MDYNFSSLKLYFSLNTKDRKSFALYVRRNYPSKKSFIVILNYLKKIEKSGANYNAEKLTKLVFKDNSKNKELGTLMSLFGEKCREWLLLEDHKKGSVEAKSLVLSIIDKRGLSEEIYFKESKKIQKRLQESTLIDINGEYNKWKTNHYAIFHSSFNHTQQGEKELLMAQAEKNLENFYLLAKLQYTYERVVTNRLLDATTIEKFLPKANSLSLEYINTSHPLIRFFALVIQLELTENINYYNDAKLLLEENDQLVSSIQLPAYFACLHNFASVSFKKKNLTAQQIFSLQKTAAERDWITGGGQMPMVLFNNIVNVGCLLKETDWVKKFINKFSVQLPLNEKKTITTIANARVYFSEKKFKKAAQLLSPLSHNINYGTLRIKSLLMCCHYELDKGDIDFLKTTFRNFQIQVQNMKVVNEEMKEGYLNFSKILQKLTNKNVNYKRLLIDAKQSNRLAYRDWLIDKIEELL